MVPARTEGRGDRRAARADRPGYSSSTRVGFDSVRSMIGLPSARRRSASVKRFGDRSPEMRSENTRELLNHKGHDEHKE